MFRIEFKADSRHSIPLAILFLERELTEASEVDPGPMEEGPGSCVAQIVTCVEHHGQQNHGHDLALVRVMRPYHIAPPPLAQSRPLGIHGHPIMVSLSKLIMTSSAPHPGSCMC